MEDIVHLDYQDIRSPWHDDLLSEFKPDYQYIDYLKACIVAGEYMAPIIVVKEGAGYILVNGHHRLFVQMAMDVPKCKAIVMDGTWEDTEPLRIAEGMLKEYDSKTAYKYQLAGYLDRWAALAEGHDFINKFQPVYINQSPLIRLLRGRFALIIMFVLRHLGVAWAK